jgi:hypothetical protein
VLKKTAKIAVKTAKGGFAVGIHPISGASCSFQDIRSCDSEGVCTYFFQTFSAQQNVSKTSSGRLNCRSDAVPPWFVFFNPPYRRESVRWLVTPSTISLAARKSL